VRLWTITPKKKWAHRPFLPPHHLCSGQYAQPGDTPNLWLDRYRPILHG
jgi:hypothetical protein